MVGDRNKMQNIERGDEPTTEMQATASKKMFKPRGSGPLHSQTLPYRRADPLDVQDNGIMTSLVPRITLGEWRGSRMPMGTLADSRAVLPHRRRRPCPGVTMPLPDRVDAGRDAFCSATRSLTGLDAYGKECVCANSIKFPLAAQKLTVATRMKQEDVC